MGVLIRKGETAAALRRIPVLIRKGDGSFPADFTGVVVHYWKPGTVVAIDVSGTLTAIGAGTGKGYVELDAGQVDTSGLGWYDWSGPGGIVSDTDWVQIDERDAQVANAVWDAADMAAHFVAGSFGELLQIVQGLLQGNAILDMYVYGANNVVTSVRLRIWRTAGAMPGAPGGVGAQGAIATFTGTGVDATGGQISSFKWVRAA